MSDSYFLDTNILIYCFDNSNPDKQEKANRLVRDGLHGGGHISWQVIQEFCNVAQKKFKVPLSMDDLRSYQELVLFPLCTVWPTEALYRETLGIKLETGFSWYDSLILNSAIHSGGTVLYTEDMQQGFVYRGITVINPFL